MAMSEQKEKLLRALKKEVKHMMEESVMLKSVHEDSGSVTSLCAIVDTCLSLGLKRRALGLFKTSSTTALMQKLAKEFDDAKEVMDRVTELEQASSGQKRAHSTGDSSSSLASKQKSPGLLEKANSGSNLAAITRYMWIRVALFEKKLQRIVAYLVEEADKYYTKDSLVADQDYGPILSSLLVGPCALEFTKVKAYGNTWTDLPANELVQRHKISSCGSSSSVSSPPSSSTSIKCGVFSPVTKESSATMMEASSPHKSNTSGGNRVISFSGGASPSHPSYRRSLSHTPVCGSSFGPGGGGGGIPPGLSSGVFFVDEAPCGGCRSIPSQAREYVESLHQNQRDSLLYGKNNVMVLPKDISASVPGYLSLHTSSLMTSSGTVLNGIALKWTPNQLMNGTTIEDKSVSWQYALNLELRSIQFIHCHQDRDESGTLILVSSDGTQQPPIQFPAGGHLMQFLGCLESALITLGGKLEPSVKQRLQQQHQHPSSQQQQLMQQQHQQLSLQNSNDSILSFSARRILPLSLVRKKQQEPVRTETSLTITTEVVTENPDRNTTSSTAAAATTTTTADSSTTTTTTLTETTITTEATADEHPAAENDSAESSSIVDCIFKIILPPPKSPATTESSSGNHLVVVTQNSLTKVRSVEWLANLFSPNKSRHNSSSTDTSRSFSLSEFNEAAPEMPHAIEEEDNTIIEAEITHSGSDQETTKLDLRSSTDGTRLDPNYELGMKSSSPSEPISTLCLTMRKQIISRAFYGWLAHCRHLRTVRKHLGGLAFHEPIIVMEETTWSEGITEEWWTKNFLEGKIDESIIYRLIYFGGIQPKLRKKIWPFLLGHYKWKYSPSDCQEVDKRTHASYENKLSDWMAIEAIVRQKDKEITAASIAKLSAESMSMSVDNASFNASQMNMSNEVFESIDEQMSSRTVSQDKISTITEATENSTSNSEDRHHSFRMKLLSTQSEPSASINENSTTTIQNISNSHSGKGQFKSVDKISGTFRDNIGSDEGIEDIADVNLTPKKLVRQNETDEENGLEEISNRSIRSCSSRRSLSSASSSSSSSSSDTEGEDFLDVTSVSEDGGGQCPSGPVHKKKGVESSTDDENVDRNGVVVASNGLHHDDVIEEESDCKKDVATVDVNVAKGIISYKITTPSVDSGNPSECSPLRADGDDHDSLGPHGSNPNFEHDLKQITQKIYNLGVSKDDTLSNASSCHSPASSEAGGIYPQELVENFALNLHRIDKDVQRCDRNLPYFLTLSNLEKLRNIITTYVWENLDIGYMQGMCDLVAPLLVIFDDEALTHACFSKLMERMLGNFPTGCQMDENFSNMRSLIQVLDQSLYETIQQNGDFSHFYFCYRWFLLDFKREFSYCDIYLVWETIWASRFVVSSHFFLFVALALVENYRDIILDRNMDFTDIIKFFNEMAEKHDAQQILGIARELVLRLQYLISDK